MRSARREELETAIATINATIRESGGVASVTIDGQSVRYEGLATLIRARRELRAELARLLRRKPACATIRFPGS